MKQFYHTTLICLLLSTITLAQTFKPTSHWRAGSSGQDGIWDIAIDSAGNQYICGYFTGTVDIDPGPGVYNLTQPSGQTQPDAFLLKLDANGNFVWAKHFGGTVDAKRYATRVKVDDAGNIYVIGVYTGNIQFDPNSNLWAAPMGNLNSPFLAKFSSMGSLIWGYGWYSSSRTIITGIEVDDLFNVYAVGGFEGTVDFDPRSGSLNIIQKSSSGMSDIFLLKIDSNGDFTSIKTLGSTGDDLFNAITKSNDDKIYLSGSFSGTIDFDWNAGTTNHTASNAVDCFVMRIDTALNFKWAKPFGGVGNEYNRNIAFKDSLLVNYGVFYQDIDIDPSSTSTVSFTSNGNKDNFVQMLDTLGNLIWAKSFGGTGNEEAYRMGITLNNEILLSGYYENTVDFDPSSTSDYILTSNGFRDGFVLKLDFNGNFLNAASYGSNNPSSIEVMVAASGNPVSEISGGNFYNTIDINPNQTVTQNVSSAGQDDMLYMRLEACTNATLQYTDSVCSDRYLLPNGTTVFQGGYYLNVLQSSQGCDSTVGVTVVLNPLPNTTITQTGATFSAQPGLTYQWLNCQTGQPIPGESNQTFTATANGQYAVIVSNGACTDTSTCITLDNIGLAEHNLPNINLYPNPTSGLLHIDSPQPWQKVEVTDLLGRNLLTHREHKTELDLSKLPTGIYLVKVFFAEGVVVRRVVKR